MITVGIDVGKGKHAVAAVDDAGRQLGTAAFYGNDRDGAEKLVAALAGLGPVQDVRIGMEATGSYWTAIRDFLAKAGYRVDVINPIVTSASIAGDVRGRKSDKGDALVIARVMLMGRGEPRKAPPGQFRRLTVLTRQRSFFVSKRSDVKLRLESHLDAVFPEFHTLFDDMFSPCATAILESYPTARALSRAHRPAVARIVKAHTRGRDEKWVSDMAEKLVKSAKRSLGVDSDMSDEVGFCIQACLAEIRGLDARVAEFDARIQELEEPELAKIVSAIKGSGKLLPRVVAGEFGDLERFAEGKGGGHHMYRRMLAFAGCEPRIRESGQWKGQVHMSKRGSGSLRTALMQLAFSVSQNDANFGAVYERCKKAGKPHKVALSHVVAALLRVVCSLWRKGRTYTVEVPA